MPVARAAKVPLCILHAGIEKTGTSALQQFLYLNEVALAQRRIWVPRALLDSAERGPFNHVRLSTASHLHIAQPDDLQAARGLRSMAMVAAHREAVARALAAEHETLPFAPELILISNEHVHSRLRDVADLARARELLAPHAVAFKVVVYLRRQDEVARSVAGMQIRHGAARARLIPDFSPAHGFDEILGVDHDYFDYEALLARLARAFGGAALAVRLYQGEGFDLIDDFFNLLDIPIAGLPRPARQNASLDAVASWLLVKINEMAQARPELSGIRQRALDYLISHHAGEMQPAPLADVLTFLRRFEASNEAVRRVWFPWRGSLFDAPLAPRAMDPRMVERQAAAVLNRILAG